eukprot:444524_1
MNHTAVIKALKFIAVWLLAGIWIYRDEMGGTNSLLTVAFVLRVSDNSAYSNLSARLGSTSSRISSRAFTSSVCRVETEVAASVTEPAHHITSVIRHGRRKRRRKRGDGFFLSSVGDIDFELVSPDVMSCSSPKKARKRLIIRSVKRKKEEELLGLDWLQLVGTSNITTRNIPDVQVLSEWYRVAEVFEKRGMTLESMRVLKRIVLADPKQEMAWLRIVDLHKATGEISQAVAVLKMALSVYPTCGSLWFALANIAKESGCYQQACLLYIKAGRRLCKGTTTTTPWSAWGWMEAELGNLQQARKVLEIGIVEAKKRKLKADPGLWHSYGVLMDQCGQSAVALEAFRRGLKVAPMDLKLRTAQGIALYRSGYVKEAKRAFRSVLDIQRTHPEASFCLGYLEECEGNFYGAHLFYEASTSSIAISAQNDLYPLGLMALARMEIKRKNFDRAVEVYSDVCMCVLHALRSRHTRLECSSFYYAFWVRVKGCIKSSVTDVVIPPPLNDRLLRYFHSTPTFYLTGQLQKH